jgi:signal transduction histidine kinase/CheY-like chemotaxis protein
MEPISNAIILVVDDEPGVTRLCHRLLTRGGYQVISVNQPKEALDILENQHVDLLLVDIRMPETDGFQLMAQARNQQADLAVVIMTGFGTVETAVESLRRGADGMVLKPFSGAELVQSIQRALVDKHRERDMQRLRALRPLFDITETLFSENNPGKLRESLLEEVCEHLACSNAAFYQQQDDDSPLTILAERGNPIQVGDVLFLRVEESERPLRINAEGPGDSELQEIIKKFKYRSVMVAPNLLDGARSLLFVGRDQEEGTFSEADLEMLAILSRQATVALENARLYTALQDHIRQIEDSQQALIQAEKMAAVGRLTASIAHEINNPLQAMHNCLHLIEHSELSAEQKQNYLDLTRSELDRLMNAVQRMLDYYRPGALDRKEVCVNDLIERVLRLLDAQLVTQGIKVKRLLPDDLPTILAVGNQIQQVIFNIILNAMEAMPDGGELSVVTRTNPTGIEILIEDSGPGIPVDDSEQIFEPFYSSKEKGLGLGLAVSYGIVTAHGGNLEVLAPDKGGACFKIVLPDKQN